MIAPAAMAALSLGVGAASAVVEHSALTRQANAQNAFYDANFAEANRASVTETIAANRKFEDERSAASQRIFEARIEGLQARSTALTAAGEAGVSGLSVNALIDDLYGKEGRNVGAIQHNVEIQSNSLDAELDSIEARRRGRINSVQRATPPSYLATALKIGTAGLNAGTYYQKATSNYRADV